MYLKEVPMLKLKEGVDILTEVGGIKSIDAARKLFEEKLDQTHLAKLGKIKNEEALLKIANAIACCQPDSVYISTGSPDLLFSIATAGRTVAIKRVIAKFDVADASNVFEVFAVGPDDKPRRHRAASGR